ncbi:hypothetical protein CVT25_007957 [Psilocybe cyanescens]|uniref:Uncharacterized protein n=1 Tax=Psilocybe cyanescens TaxID=93625 RepID=A0A409XN65_PSICY|nr:hypothetical protein CVT25_007957 [Psilocybe cyanescens]
MSTVKGKRTATIPSGTKDCHLTSSDATTPPVASSKKNRGKKPETSSKPVSNTPSAPTEVPFNPKSILPVSKPQKSLSKLLEASASVNKHSRSQSCSFPCIDGSVRTFDAQSSSYSFLCEESSLPPSTSRPDVSTDQYQLPSTSSEVVPQREQFKAFGIEAFPTKAVLNELCYDFIDSKRWCPHGHFCYRIHPLHKATYLSTVIKERALYNRMRREGPQRNTMESVLHEPIQSGSLQESRTSSTHDMQIRVKLPHTQSSSRNTASSSGFSQISKSHSKVTTSDILYDKRWINANVIQAREDESERWNTTQDMRKPPWADHPPSDTSSSSNGSDEGDAHLWEPHSVPEDWLAAAASMLPVASTSAWQSLDAPTIPLPSSSNPPVSSLTTHILRLSQTQASSPQPSCGSHEHPQVHPRPSRISYEQPQLHPRPSRISHEHPQVHPLPSRPFEPEVGSSIKHYRPKNNKRCHRWLRDECQLGFDCEFVHDDLDYDIEMPTRIVHPAQVPQAQAPPPPAQRAEHVSQASQERQAQKMPQVTGVPQTPQAPEPAPISKVKHPRPRCTERCRKWLRDECTLGYDCRWAHDDLEYDDDEPVRRGLEVFSWTLHDHMRIRVGAGFEVEQFTTGFESQWVSVGNLPHQLPEEQLVLLLGKFGEILDIRRENPVIARVQFSKPADAYKAFTTLHGVMEFGRKLELRMAVEKKVGGSRIQDTVVRIEWDAPHRNVYMGYESMDAANAVVAKARNTPYEDFMTQANVHIGIPAVGLVTVKFSGLPVHVTEEKMEEVYGPHQGMVTERPNYKEFTVEDTINGVKKLLNQFNGKIADLEFRPPPYRDGKMRAWAHFNTPNDAKAAAENLHGRKPIFTGHTRIMARHIKTINYTLSNENYRKVSLEIRALGETIWRQGGGYSLTTMEKTTHFALRLCGEDIQILRRLKSEVERTINGELLLENGAVTWDEFFGWPPGFAFLQELERIVSGVRIERDVSRRTIRLFGVAKIRALAGERILEKIGILRAQKTLIIPLEGRLAHVFSSGDYEKLQARLGADNLMLDVWNQYLRVRGDQDTHDIAKDAVNAARIKLQILCSGRGSLSSSVHECPVCFSEPSNPVKLGCGHAWCRGCLHRYFIASIDQKFFPLTCLGNEAKCKERIPLFNARAVLSAGELDSVVNAAFAAHVQTHPKEYHYCPTPDCSQVYRSAPEGVFIQCPSCLVRICPSCHKDAHDGQTCSEVKSGDELFKMWTGKHDVKQCPGCSIAIEKDEGCNHMVCTMCKTHVCWVCMKTFPNGAGIYAHMQGEHGDFGLGPII